MTLVAFVSFIILHPTCWLICHQLSRSPAAVAGTPNGATFVSARKIWMLTVPKLRNWKRCIAAHMHALCTKGCQSSQELTCEICEMLEAIPGISCNQSFSMFFQQQRYLQWAESKILNIVNTKYANWASHNFQQTRAFQETAKSTEGDTLRVRFFHCSLTHALTVPAWHICNGYVTTLQPFGISAWHLCNGYQTLCHYSPLGCAIFFFAF